MKRDISLITVHPEGPNPNGGHGWKRFDIKICRQPAMAC